MRGLRPELRSILTTPSRRNDVVKDRIEYGRYSRHDVAVPEADDQETGRFESFCPLGIADNLLRLGMLTAIEFDNQAGVQAAEVGDVTGDGRLPPEFQAVETAVAQVLPEFVFCWSERAAQFSGDGCVAGHLRCTW